MLCEEDFVHYLDSLSRIETKFTFSAYTFTDWNVLNITSIYFVQRQVRRTSWLSGFTCQR